MPNCSENAIYRLFSLLFRAAATPFQFTGFFFPPHSSPRKCINLKRLQILVLPTKAAHPFLSLFCSEENLIKSRRVIFFAVNFGGTGDPPFPKKESPFFEKNGKLKGVVPLYNVILLCFVPKKVLFSYLQRKYC